MSVSKRLRYEVLRRDNHRCRYCGTTADDSPLTVDHVTPVSLGGEDEPGNLVASCKDCNAGKSSASPDASQVADVEQDALRWSEAMKAAGEALRAADEHRERFVIHVYAAFKSTLAPNVEVLSGKTWHYNKNPERSYPYAVVIDGNEHRAELFDDEDDAYDRLQEIIDSGTPPVADDWAGAARAWFDAGLDGDDVWKMVKATKKAKRVSFDQKWRYFCGCMWSRLTERQKIARDLLAAEEE